MKEERRTEPQSDEASADGKANAPLPMDRRNFLKNALAGSVALHGLAAIALSKTGEVHALTRDPNETWIEPWTWQVGEWPGETLQLNVVESQNPTNIVGLGNPGAIIFSYGGQTPGPTIRMRGDQTLLIKLRNLLKEDLGSTFVKHYPDPAQGNRPPGLTQNEIDETARALGYEREDWCLGEHVNGVHSAHVTNLHTHGLHVHPGVNPDGTYADDVLVRIIPLADHRRRAQSTSCRDVREGEIVAQADYAFRLGNVMGRPGALHPPGTHWYHPHAHGSTHNQVTSGMAGYLIVEGDVDEAINTLFTGSPTLQLEEKTGNYDYRERLMFIQRVVNFNVSSDPNAPKSQSALKNRVTPFSPSVNGNATPMTIAMRPGAIERWRVLNGSVDNRGYLHFMVLKGKFVVERLGQDTASGFIYELKKEISMNTYAPVTREEIETAKEPLYQLAMDGITLVTTQSGTAKYAAKDLSKQNANTQNSLTKRLDESQPNQSMLSNIDNCFKDGASIKNSYVRPNEVYLAPANRADVLFRAPTDEGTYTVLAYAGVLHSDDYQQRLQQAVHEKAKKLVPPPGDLVVAYVKVAGNACPTLDVVQKVNQALARVPVPEFLQPIADREVRIAADSPEVGVHTVGVGQVGKGETRSMNIDVKANQYRTRVVCYSGWGASGFPLITAEDHPAFDQFIANNPHLEKLIYAKSGNTNVLLTPNLRTMAINEQFDPIFEDSNGQPPASRKFDINDPTHPLICGGYNSGVPTWPAEEWVLNNSSIPLWGNTDKAQQPDGQFESHYISYPMLRADGQARFAEDSNFRIVTRGIDHPFHIHVNPFYVLRIDIPDENGDLHNILDEPRWQDVIWIPRGGRIVFRSRFPDYVGKYVHHCHLLLHEDMGMMHAVETTSDPRRANYVPRDSIVSPEMTAAQVDDIYPFPGGASTPEERLITLYKQSIGFIDANATGQIFPGFDIEPPKIPSAPAPALSFDGSSTYVIRNPFSAFPNRAFTVELWVKADARVTYGTLLCYSTTAQRNELNLYYESSLLYLYINGPYLDTGIAINDSEWHHYAATWNSSSGQFKVYRDGTQTYAGTTRRNASLANRGSLVFGRSQRSPGNFFSDPYALKGEMAEVRLWNTVLSQQDIQGRMNRRLQGNEAGLVGYWPLDDGQGAKAADKSRNGNDGTIYGGSWLRPGDLPINAS